MPIIWGVTNRGLCGKLRNFANGQIAYGHVGKNIGYWRILAMGGYSRRGSVESDLRILESTLDTILSDTDPRSLVLDLRINFGGNDEFWAGNRVAVRKHGLRRVHKTGTQ